ncbi:MAG: hypothetical protein F6K24_44765, partial [Okeania sp. SIO2D1]|nr:hypothetical protein [Okeania sp. SIO2D1]
VSNGIFISRELEEILEKMLKTEVGERWQSVDEILPILKRNPTQNYSPSPIPKSTTEQQHNFCRIVGIDCRKCLDSDSAYQQKNQFRNSQINCLE